MKPRTKKILIGTAVAAALAALALAVAARVILSDLPDVTSLRSYRPSVTTTLWSRDGALMAELCDENRYVVDAAALPEYVIQAFLAAEDSNFFQHEGLAWHGILRAALKNVQEGRISQGGSTITQQVAKSLLLTPERSFRRKFREIVLALRIEKSLNKNEILHLYLNQIYLGHGAYGIEAAAKGYFGATASRLTLAQAALLAGLPQAPSRYDPYRNPKAATERRSYVLERMRDEGWITAADAEKADKSPLTLVNPVNAFKRVAPFYTEYVRRLLEAKYGADAVLRQGLRVVTPMDSRLQAVATAALRKGLETYDHRLGYRGAVRQLAPSATEEFLSAPPLAPGERSEALVTSVKSDQLVVACGGQRYLLEAKDLAWAVPEGRSLTSRFFPGDVILVDAFPMGPGRVGLALAQEPKVEGALIALNAHTGEVLAEVGGYSYERNQFDRATQARRQAGSSIKPFIYTAAVERGFTPANVIYDSPIVYDAAGLPEAWKPQNYGEKFYGPTTLWEALVQSRNVVTIKVLQDIGVDAAIDLLRRAGLKNGIEPNLSLALGSCGVSLAELSAAYGVFATGGHRFDPAFVTSVTDRDGNLLETFTPPPPGPPVIDPRVVCVVNNMMQGVIREGTGAGAQGLPVQSAGKTGTTNDARDAWFMGVTPDVIVGVWVGFDDNRSLGERETGGRIAAPIWKEVMATAVRRYPGADFPVPEGIEFATIDADTGRLAGRGSRRAFQAAFLAGTAPGSGGSAAPATAGRASGAPSFDANDPAAMEMLR